jgi:hypothetical protein
MMEEAETEIKKLKAQIESLESQVRQVLESSPPIHNLISLSVYNKIKHKSQRNSPCQHFGL